MTQTHVPAAEFIADHAKELSVLAKNEGHDCLDYILQMAELEARRVIEQTRAVRDAA